MQLAFVAGPSGHLAVRSTNGTGSPLVCLHGFTLHGGMFAGLAALLGRPVLAPDLPGHGRTTIAPVDLPTTTGALTDWLADGPGRSTVLGYSQGGRIALHIAAHHPDLVASLVLVSTTPGLAPAERTARRRDDAALAARLESDGLATFLDRWLAHPTIGSRRVDAATAVADRRLRTENTAAGLAAALRGLGQGATPPVDLAGLATPTLWIAGGDDTRYADIAEAAARATGGELSVVPGAGHNLVLERPDALVGLINRFAALRW